MIEKLKEILGYPKDIKESEDDIFDVLFQTKINEVKNLLSQERSGVLFQKEESDRIKKICGYFVVNAGGRVILPEDVFKREYVVNILEETRFSVVDAEEIKK